MSWETTISSILSHVDSNLSDRRTSIHTPSVLRKSLGSSFSAARNSASNANTVSSIPDYEPRSSTSFPVSQNDVRFTELRSIVDELCNFQDQMKQEFTLDLATTNQLFQDKLNSLRNEIAPLKGLNLESAQVSQISRDLTSLSGRFDSLSKSVTTTTHQLSTLSQRFSAGDLPCLRTVHDNIAELKERVEHRFGKVEREVSEIKSGLLMTNQNVERLSNLIEDVRNQLTFEMAQNVTSFDQRVKNEIDSVNQFISGVESRTNQSFDTINENRAHLESQVHELTTLSAELREDFRQSSIRIESQLTTSINQLSDSFPPLISSSKVVKEIKGKVDSMLTDSVKQSNLIDEIQSRLNSIDCSSKVDEFDRRLADHDRLVSEWTNLLANQPKSLSHVVSQINSLAETVNLMDSSSPKRKELTNQTLDNHFELPLPTQSPYTIKSTAQKSNFDVEVGEVFDPSSIHQSLTSFSQSIVDVQSDSSDEEVNDVSSSPSSIASKQSTPSRRSINSPINSPEREQSNESTMSFSSRDDDFHQSIPSRSPPIPTLSSPINQKPTVTPPIKKSAEVSLNDGDLDWLDEALSDLDSDLDEDKKEMVRGSDKRKDDVMGVKKGLNSVVKGPNLSHLIADVDLDPDDSDISFSLSPTIKKSHSQNRFDDDDLSDMETRSEPSKPIKQSKSALDSLLLQSTVAVDNDSDTSPPMRRAPFEIPSIGPKQPLKNRGKSLTYSDDELDNVANLSSSSFDFD
ncbi:hypothetical protein RCL1_005122 [Eukaryota sp. TZLM3-RCL]